MFQFSYSPFWLFSLSLQYILFSYSPPAYPLFYAMHPPTEQQHTIFYTFKPVFPSNSGVSNKGPC